MQPPEGIAAHGNVGIMLLPRDQCAVSFHGTLFGSVSRTTKGKATWGVPSVETRRGNPPLVMPKRYLCHSPNILNPWLRLSRVMFPQPTSVVHDSRCAEWLPNASLRCSLGHLPAPGLGVHHPPQAQRGPQLSHVLRRKKRRRGAVGRFYFGFSWVDPYIYMVRSHA